MHEKFVRERITELRLRKNVSEYQMSSDLGRSSGYLYNISSGKALPSLRELFAIVEYFGITLSDFFNTQSQYPDLITEAVQGMSRLKQEDVEALIGIIGRMSIMRDVIEDLTAGHNEVKPHGEATPLSESLASKS